MDLQVRTLARRLRDTPSEDRATRARHERALVALYQQDPQRYSDVIGVFEAFAASFALRLKRGEEPLDDLRQVARFGLLKALDRFDPTVGRSFTAYAAPTILGELRRHYRDTGWAVHVPRAGQELAQKVTRIARHVESLGLETTVANLAEHSDLSEEQIVEGRVARRALRTGSLDRPVDDDDGAATFADIYGSEDPGFARADNQLTVQSLLRDLPERDRNILTLRFGAGLPQSEIGRRVGISQMQTSRELRRILRLLGTRETVA